MAAQIVLDKIDSDPGYFESVCSCSALPKDGSLSNDDDDDEELLD